MVFIHQTLPLNPAVVFKTIISLWLFCFPYLPSRWLMSPLLCLCSRLRRSFAGSWRRRRHPVCFASWETSWETISTTTERGSCRADAAPDPCAPKLCYTFTTRSSSSVSTVSRSHSKSMPCRYKPELESSCFGFTCWRKTNWWECVYTFGFIECMHTFQNCH